VSGQTCPTCGKLVVFSWAQGEAPPDDTPVCSPLSSPKCWHQAGTVRLHREVRGPRVVMK
jgi:hypothetical protein